MRMPFRTAAAGLCLSAAAFVLTLTGAPAGHAQQPAPPVPAAARPGAPALVPVRPAAPAAETQAEQLARAATRIIAANEHLVNLFPTDDTTVLVRLDLRDATIREAARQIAEQTKREIIVDADVSDSVRVSLNAANLRFATALDVLSQAAGVRWGRELLKATAGRVGSERTVYRVGKNVSAFATPIIRFLGSDMAATYSANVPSLSTQFHALGNGLVYTYPQREERSTFTCPHCKRQATVIRKVETPKCPKCERAFQSSWQFCPHDGTRRPAGETTWKACPFCGKQVSRADTNEPPKTPSAPAVG